MFLVNFLQIFKVSSGFLKLKVLGSFFILNLVEGKRLLNNIATLKRYEVATRFFFPDFSNFFQVFKSTQLWVYF